MYEDSNLPELVAALSKTEHGCSAGGSPSVASSMQSAEGVPLAHLSGLTLPKVIM